MMPKLKPGDEVLIRATVTAIWQDGSVTIVIKSAGQKVTLPNTTDLVPVSPKANSGPDKKRGLFDEKD